MTSAPKKNATVTKEELAETEDLTRMMLLMLTQHSVPVGLTGVIMATAIAGVAAGLPKEELLATVTRTVDDVYSTEAVQGTSR